MSSIRHFRDDDQAISYATTNQPLRLEFDATGSMSERALFFPLVPFSPAEIAALRDRIESSTSTLFFQSEVANDNTSIFDNAWLGERLRELREEAASEEMPYSVASDNALQDFLLPFLGGTRPAIFLLGNGNLRAVWRNEHNEQIGIQFMDDGVQFVLFVRRGDSKLARSAGQDTSEGVLEQVRALGLMHLLVP